MQFSHWIVRDVVGLVYVLVCSGDAFHGNGIDIHAVVVVAVPQVQQTILPEVSREIISIGQSVDVAKNFVLTIGSDSNQLVGIHLDAIDVSICGAKASAIDFESSSAANVNERFIGEVDFGKLSLFAGHSVNLIQHSGVW